jgi:hypothetical protein
MKTSSKSSQILPGYRQSRPVVSQTLNNTTLWIGHLQTETNDRLGGQTFCCPSEGLVDNIQVYSSAVTQPGELILTLHEFDEVSQSWGPSIGISKVQVEKDDAAKWIRFDLAPVTLEKNKVYGFRLQSNDGVIGIGEAASNSQQPFLFGREWNGDNNNQQGKYFTYFSLAFKVEMCA